MAKKIPNEETRKAIRNTKNSTELSRDFYSVFDLMEELYSDDKMDKNEYDACLK